MQEATIQETLNGNNGTTYITPRRLQAKFDAFSASGGGGAVDSVNGKTGVVVLTKSDIGLNNVDNTADADKPITTAMQTALNNKVDKVAGKGLSTNDFTSVYKAGIEALTDGSDTSLHNHDTYYYRKAASDAKYELKLPATPSNPNTKFLNGNKEWTDIVVGASGSSGNLYLKETASGYVPTYKSLSYENDANPTVHEASRSAVGESLVATYIFDYPIGVNSIDAGIWFFNLYGKVSNTAGNSKLKVEVFKRDTDGNEMTLFSAYSAILSNTSYLDIATSVTKPMYTVSSTDRIGIRTYFVTTVAATVTFNSIIGGVNPCYARMPLALRHSQLRLLNGDEAYQHINSNDRQHLDNLSGVNTGDDNKESMLTKLGASAIDNDGYLKKEDYAYFKAKPDEFVSGVNIKTINGISLLGGGDISMGGSNLIKNSAGIFGSLYWDKGNSFSTFLKNPGLVGITRSASEINVILGTVKTSIDNIVGVTLDQIKSLSYKMRLTAGRTARIILYSFDINNPLYYYERSTPTDGYEDIYDENLNQFMTDSSSLTLVLECEGGDTADGLFISDLMLNNGIKAEWQPSISEIDGDIISMNQERLYAIKKDKSAMFVVSGDGYATFSLVDGEPSEKLFDMTNSGIETIDIIHSGKYVQKNMFNEIINNGTYDIYIEYIKEV